MPPKRKTLDVTEAQVKAILRDIKPITSSKDQERYDKQTASYVKKLDRAAASSAKRRNSSSRRSTDALYGITTGPDGKKRYAKRGPETTPATDKYLAQRDRAVGDQKEQGGGKQKEKEKSLFNKTVDFLMRGTHASAGAFREGFDPKTKEFYEFGEAMKGFKKGISGKGKDTFKDVLGDHGYTGKGAGTLGFALDIAADPTTYMGVGLIGKTGKGSKVIGEGLEKTAKLADDLSKSTPNVSKSAIQSALGAERIAVKNLKRRTYRQLSPQAQELVHVAKAAQKSTKGKRLGLNETVVLGKNVKGSAKRVKVDFSWIDDVPMREAATKAADDIIAKNPGLNHKLRMIASDPASPHLAYASKDESLIAFNKTWKSRAAVEKILRAEPKSWSSVGVNTVEDYIKRTTIHELGHQLSRRVPDNEVDEIFEAIAKAYPNREAFAKDIGQYAVSRGSEASRKSEVLAEGWTQYQMLGAKASPIAQKIGKAFEKHSIKGTVDVNTKKLLSALADDAAVVTGRSKDEIMGEISTRLMDNLSPEVKRELAIRVGGATVQVPVVASVFRNTANVVGSPKFIQKSVETFNKGFRANAYIPESVRQLRATEHSIGANFVREYGREIQSVWDKLNKSTRAEVAKAYGRGNVQGLSKIAGGRSAKNNTPVDDVMQYLDEEITNLNLQVKNLGLSANEINTQLGKQFQVKEGKTTTTVITKGDEAAGESLKATARSKTEFNQDFFAESIKKSMADGTIKDPAVALYTYATAVNQAIAKRQLWKSIGETHGVRLNSSLGKELEKQGWKKAVVKEDAAIHGIEDTVFQPEVADAVSRMAEVFGSSRSTGEFIRYYDRSLMAVKAVLTKYNPAFHPRTFMGEVILGYMGGMKPRTMPLMYEKAALVLRGRNEEFLGGGLQGARGEASRANVQTANVLRVGRNAPIAGSSKVVLRKQFGNKVVGINADQVWHHYMNSGLKSGFASTDMVRGAEQTVAGGVLRSIGDASQRATEAIEDTGRLAHFLDAIKYSKAGSLEDALAEASAIVRKAHLDYNEVTNFEKSVMARAIPFYKWLRLSTPLMAEILLTQPGKALAIPKTMDYAARAAGYDPENIGSLPGGPDAAVPDYLLGNGALPVGNLGTANSQWFNPTALFPLTGSLGMASEASEGPGGLAGAVTDVINPLAAIPFELGLDAQNKGAAPSNDMVKYAAGQTPQTNFARKMFVNEDPSVSKMELLLKFLGNPGFVSNTPRTIEGAAFQQQQEAFRQRREALRPIKEARQK